MAIFYRTKVLRNQPDRLLALLLSITAHLGLIVVLGNGESVGAKGSVSPQRQHESTPIIVTLLKTPESAAIPVAPVPANVKNTDSVVKPPEPELVKHDTSAAESTDRPIDPPQAVEQKPSEAISILPVLTPTEARYFEPDELTEKPHVLRDSTPDQAIVLPDIFPQPAIVHLLINEQGDIDKVMIDESFLSDEAKRFVIEAFAKTKFYPGKLGDMPVKSQLKIEVRLDNTLQALPIP